jgi:hypothetical protein
VLHAVLTIVLVALVVPARAQQVLPPYRLQPITAPVRNAGVLHLASGTWTRKASAAGLSADIVYNNTCSTGYYSPLSGDTYVTNGRVPSPTSPDTLWSKPGCATSTTIDGFQIAYCTDQPVPGVITVSFYNSYDCCASVIGVTPTATFALSGLPGAALGASACWTVTIDLDSPPQSASLAFTLLADRDGSYDGGGVNGGVDSFGWSIRSSLSGAAAQSTGPWIAGDANVCLQFDGTRWDPAVDYDEPGTGMGTCAALRIEAGPALPAATSLDRRTRTSTWSSTRMRAQSSRP